MKQRLRRIVTTGVLAVFMLFTLVLPAFAGTAYSNYSYFTDGGYGYRNQASVMTDTWGAIALTYIGSYPEVTRPAGWYGALARLYNDSGVLVAQRGYVYSGSACVGMKIPTYNYTVHDSYRSYGVSKSWNGSSYVGHATWTSPYQTY
ncbi:MAG: hypothetical protein RBS17_06510 [Coriobacteriia bacterium]|nr:hypothetical protein [Coriobacteriia bacterium]